MEKADNILENAKILLISDMIDDYKTLETLGFKNIHFIRTMENADSHFQDNLEELNSYFIIITGFQSIYNYRVIKNMTLPNDIKNLKERKYFYEEPNNRMPYPWFLEVFIKVPNDKLEEEWNIDNHSLTSIITGCLNNLGYEIKNIKPTIKEKINPKRPIVKKEISDKEVYNHIKSMALTYLSLKENGYTVNINDLNIYKNNKEIRIEYMIDGIIVSAVTMPIEDFYDDVFMGIELINNKRKLAKNEVGIYQSEDENIPIRRINDKELLALKIIEDKLSNYLDNLKRQKPYVLKHQLW